MSTENGGGAPPEDKVVNCECGRGLLRTRVPRMSVMNGSVASVVVIPHDPAIKCNACGREFITVINKDKTLVSIDLKETARSIAEREASPIIRPH